MSKVEQTIPCPSHPFENKYFSPCFLREKKPMEFSSFSQSSGPPSTKSERCNWWIQASKMSMLPSFLSLSRTPAWLRSFPTAFPSLLCLISRPFTTTHLMKSTHSLFITFYKPFLFEQEISSLKIPSPTASLFLGALNKTLYLPHPDVLLHIYKWGWT